MIKRILTELKLLELERESDYLLAFLIAMTVASFAVAGSVLILSRL